MSKYTNAKHLREGDLVVAICGNDKGKSGRVLARRGDKVIVEGLAMHKKHVKKSERYPQGGTIDRETPIHVSNVLICNESGTPLKLKLKVAKDGTRELYYMNGEREESYRSIKKQNTK